MRTILFFVATLFFTNFAFAVDMGTIIGDFMKESKWIIKSAAAAGAIYYAYLILVKGESEKTTYFAFIALLTLFGAYDNIKNWLVQAFGASGFGKTS